MGVNVIRRPRNHHVRRKYLLVATGHFQVAVAVIRYEKKTVTGLICPTDQISDGLVGSGDVMLTHLRPGVLTFF
jgi:hypothetical protein